MSTHTHRNAPTTTAQSRDHESPRTLLDAIRAGDQRVALTFAGNGTPWIPELRALVVDHPGAWRIIEVAAARLGVWADDQRVRWSGLVPDGFDVIGWIRDTRTLPTADQLASSPLSQPGIFLAQMARLDQLVHAGLDLEALSKVAVATSGYSQGVMAATLLSEACGRGRLDPERIADYAVYLAWQGFLMSRCWRDHGPGRPGADELPPMVAISGPDTATLSAEVAALGDSSVQNTDGPLPAPVISMTNSRTRHVVSGTPADLARLQTRLEARSERETKARKAGQHGGSVLAFTWDPLPVECAYHSPYMAPGVQPMRDVLAEPVFTSTSGEHGAFAIDKSELAFPVLDTATGADLREADDVLERLLQLQYVEPVRWADVTAAIGELAPDAVLDFGAGPGIARVTASGLRGHGVRVVSLSEPSGRAQLLQAELRSLPKPADYRAFAPTLVTLPDGRVTVDNRYTRATGHSPAILPGMTPTTVEVPIVAAAANAGHTAELAGGGQVTERIFDLRMAELAEALEPGAEVVFNALFMDRYLWDLHFGAQKLVQKARKAGAPIGGVTISAGIPEASEGVALLDEFAALGMRHNAFKPGTVKQVDQVLAIADAAPHHTVFMHLEGGKAGGHHSWEDLEDLLLATYHRIRQRDNVVLCVGGGIADEARATALLTGQWAAHHGLMIMPVDAVLLGTVTMACLEAGTSPQVKAALATAGGTDAWVPSGTVVGGVTSGKSQLDADIHYLEGAAARCGRLLDAVAGDAEAIASRRAEIIDALNATAKPYFGDFGAMSWQAVLERMVALMATGRGGRYEDGIWPDVSFRARVADLLRLAEARLLGLRASAGSQPSVLGSLSELDDPAAVLERFAAAFPEASEVSPHPVDEETFVKQICRRPGKPVPFVPVIDADVRRWFKSDSLWQAHDDRLAADQVLTIPGPEAVRGITRVDEPVAELLERFTQRVVSTLTTSGSTPTTRRWLKVPSRRTLPSDVRVDAGEGTTTWRVTGAAAADAWCDALVARHDGAVARAFAADRVVEAGRVVPNPLRALCPCDVGATLWLEPEAGELQRLTWRTAAAPDEAVRLSLLSDGSLQLAVDLPGLAGREALAWTRSLRIDDAGRVHLAPMAPTDVRRFYDAHLFGAEQPAVALFAPAVAEVDVPAEAALAYGVRSGGPVGAQADSAAPADLVFHVGFAPLMQALGADEVAGGLLSLVHLEHCVVPGAAWPLQRGERLRATARLTRVAVDAGGARVDALLTLHRGEALVASAEEAFYLRGFAAGGALAGGLMERRDEVIDADHTVADAAMALWLSQHDGIDWQQAPEAGERLHLGGWQKLARGTDARRFSASVAISGDQGALGQLVGDGELDGAVSPLDALLQLLPCADVVADGPEKDLAVALDRAPDDLVTWSEISGDANPIHRSLLMARLAGLDAPIVHGMWTAARARAFAVRHLCEGDASRLVGLRTRFVATLLPGTPVELRATRVGALAGRQVVRLSVLTNAGPVLEADAEIALPTTAYVFPGQGIQKPGMGMDAYARSKAAREVWDRADAFTRKALGFSLLHVVRDNPKELICHGRRDVHAKGVLYLTQYTQVAMATLAQAQIAELEEAGAMDPAALLCGHSIGEYNALSAIAKVLPLETVVAVVWHRGLTMHTCVPRDAAGRSGYAMGVIRPHHAGLSHDEALALVAQVAEDTGGFVEIVNFNVAGRQYSTVGDLATLAALEARLMARQRAGGKAPWVTVPGIDVPFHSTRLRGGVPAFRATLERLLPETGYLGLVGRYIPNLVAVPFALTPAFVEAMVEATGAPEVEALRAAFDADGSLVRPDEEFARRLVIELFAFQFASPVRWIETQDLMLRARTNGGLGVRRLVEVGVGYQPTLVNMAHQTLAAMHGRGADHGVAVLNIEANAAAVLLRDGGGLDSVLPREVAQPDVAEPELSASVEATAAPAAAPAAVAAPTPVAVAAPAATTGPSDRPVTHLDALRTLLALQAKVRPEQVMPGETLDDLFGGVSSRRNQALVDLGAEFDAGAIDGAHEMPIAKLAETLAERASGWRCPGGYLRKAQDEALRRAFGRAGLGRAEVSARLSERYGLGDGLVQAAMNQLCVEERSGDSSRGGSLGGGLNVTAAAGLDDGLDALTAALSAQLGVAIAPLGGGESTGGAAVDAAVVRELEERVLGEGGVLSGIASDLNERLGLGATVAPEDPELAELKAMEARLGAEHGEGWLDMVAPRFSAQQHVALTSAWAWARRDVATLYHDVRRGALRLADATGTLTRLAGFADDPVVADRARFLAGKAEAAGDAALAAALTAVATGEAPAGGLPLRPSRPQVDLDSRGRRTFTEVPDTAEGALERLLGALRNEGGVPHVAVTGSDEANAAFWRQLEAGQRFGFRGRTALVTGASPGSIAVEVVRHLLRGGARVVVTTSSPRRARIQWYRELYQAEAAAGAELHVVPFNQASVQDTQALVDWLFDRVTEPDGANVRQLKPPFAPDLVVPFAALGDAATTDRLGPRSEAAIRVMLTGVERLVAGIGARYAAMGQPETPCHVVLPLSPNHGGFGGDGAYAETKAGLEVMLNKWASERDAWGASVALCAARIGWVRGTGLMDANDGVAADLEDRTGARTFASAEMGWLLAGLCTSEMVEHARTAPLNADLTGGFGRIPAIREVVGGIRADLEEEARLTRGVSELEAREAALRGDGGDVLTAEAVAPLPAWPQVWPRTPEPVRAAWPSQSSRLEDTVVIVGAGELGPCGSGRTRWALEVEDELSAAAVLELAWMSGLVRWQDAARGSGWIDAESEEPVAEAEIAARYGEAVRKLSGIRWTEPDMAGFDPDHLPVLTTAWLDRDFTFDVADEDEANSFIAADPEHTRAAMVGGRWKVTRTKGAEIRVPRRAKLDRKVLGMVPTGLSYGRFGLPGDLVESVDRVTLMNLVATADAFLDAGLTPEELLANVHPARVANTQGSGLGGMQSLKRLFTDQLLDQERQGDIVQEMLINVVAAYTVQSYVGSYGPMVHPVGACATAAVSLEEGLDKIRAGRADFSVAGGFDDVTAEGVVGFSDMQATADTAKMAAMGFDPDQMSRANDLRRRGFVEAQGGGTLLLCRGDVARDLGLPVRGVLAWAGSFSDGVHTSIPAPGLGVVAAAMGGQRSPLGQALGAHGLSADDVALIYKHDTSTAANDPNENLIHDTIQRALGRTPGNPLWVVSQKTLTGHAKGGAAAFQTVGLCQSLATGVIAGNRNLECVDPKMRRFSSLAFTDTAVTSAEPLRAGLVTSLGFGHVGAIALIVHPAAFEALVQQSGGDEALATWQERATARELETQRRRVAVLQGKEPLFVRRSERPVPEQDAELAMLLDPEGRVPHGAHS